MTVFNCLIQGQGIISYSDKEALELALYAKYGTVYDRLLEEEIAVWHGDNLFIHAYAILNGKLRKIFLN